MVVSQEARQGSTVKIWRSYITYFAEMKRFHLKPVGTNDTQLSVVEK